MDVDNHECKTRMNIHCSNYQVTAESENRERIFISVIIQGILHVLIGLGHNPVLIRLIAGQNQGRIES